MSTARTLPIRASVAMCTYNGAAYVEAQLRSILAQDRPVDEIIVSDDGSTDDTVERVRQVLAAGSVPWQLLPGQRLGITQNFARAVGACTGDVIFLSDQDDTWLPHKVSSLLDLLESDPACDLVFSNARLVDAQLQDLGRSQFDVVRLSPRLRAALAGPQAFETLLRRNVVTGATVAFRKRLLDTALPFVDGWLHDEWLAIVAAARGPLHAHADALVLYRQHGRNQCGMSAEPVSRQIRHAVGAVRPAVGEKRLASLAQRLSVSSLRLDMGRQHHLNAALVFQQRRDRLPTSRLGRALTIATLALRGDYLRYDGGIRAAAKDLLASR